MGKTTKWTLTLSAMLVAMAATACDRSGRAPRLEVRTFELEHLRPHEAEALIDPYVFERDPGSGYVSALDGAITVRETRDNLDQIERVLGEFDVARPDTRLHFQLIEADGFTDSDPRIADVEGELRKLFQFRGYRLAGEAFVSTTESSEIVQSIRAGDTMYEVSAAVFRMAPGVIRLQEVRLLSEFGLSLETTVNVRPGQTIVLGSSPKSGSTATLLLTLRAEEGPGPS